MTSTQPSNQPPRLLELASKALSKHYQPDPDGSLPFVYVKPSRLPKEASQEILKGNWLAPAVQESNARKTLLYGPDHNLDRGMAINGEATFPGLPLNAISKRVFTVAYDYEPDARILILRVDSEVDLTFWLQLEIPIDRVEQALSSPRTPQTRRYDLEVQGRVGEYIAERTLLYSGYREEYGPPGNRRCFQASLRRDDEDPNLALLEVVAPHCPDFGLLFHFTAERLANLCAWYHPESIRTTLPLEAMELS